MADALTGRCPGCKGPRLPRTDNPAFPFCSNRCKLIDLGAWLSGDYRIPVPDDESEGESPDDEEMLVH